LGQNQTHAPQQFAAAIAGTDEFSRMVSVAQKNPDRADTVGARTASIAGASHLRRNGVSNSILHPGMHRINS
jgi:23S rRNA G2445 N2-methylase RlmL